MILVTGAAGKTGLAVIGALARRGESVRALVHRPAQREEVRGAGAAEVAVGDQRDRRVLASALGGVEAVYHIAPNVHPDELAMGRSVVAACQHVGVTRLVYHSVIHPQLETMPHHWHKLRVEEAVIGSALRWTILRPCAYLQNVLGYLRDARDEGVYRVPYATGHPAWMVDLADVAEVAGRVLTEDGHVYATYDLCGPQGLSATGVATILSQHLGRAVEAERIDPDDWREEAQRSDLDPRSVDLLHAMFRHYDTHGVPGNPRILEMLLGRAPGGLEDVLERDAVDT
ncbi:MAG: NmrA family NAD(P)-binding protein [Nitriliruptorales bacterium]|nr:NmrA family NAD(P)-binding protein [Nitriliruptorales bacterium]